MSFLMTTLVMREVSPLWIAGPNCLMREEYSFQSMGVGLL
jgi:hypothetical protein